jgi:hypothetical protein
MEKGGGQNMTDRTRHLDNSPYQPGQPSAFTEFTCTEQSRSIEVLNWVTDCLRHVVPAEPVLAQAGKPESRSSFTKQTQNAKQTQSCHSREACPVGMGSGDPVLRNEPKMQNKANFSLWPLCHSACGEFVEPWQEKRNEPKLSSISGLSSLDSFCTNEPIFKIEHFTITNDMEIAYDIQPPIQPPKKRSQFRTFSDKIGIKSVIPSQSRTKCVLNEPILFT